MDYIIGAEGEIKGELIKKWFEENIGEAFENKYSAIAFLEKDNIKAAAIFVNYTGANIDFHYFGPIVIRGNYRKILDYVFNHLKCIRLTTIPHRKHIKTLNILPRMGFIHECTLKNYYGIDDENDGLVYKLTKEQAKKWIDIK